MKLFVDVDDTLILYYEKHTWDLSQTSTYDVNFDLIEALEIWCKYYPETSLVVWSGTGAKWAEEISQALFPHMTITMVGSKFSFLRDIISEDDMAIDDRLQESRTYLKKFRKVFLPEEFVEYVKTIITNV